MTDASASMGFAHFLAHADGVAKSILIAMLLASIASWYLILTKAIGIRIMRARSKRFLDFFWNAPSLNEVAQHVELNHPREPFSHLAYHGLIASRHHARHGAHKLDEAGSVPDFITRILKRTIDEDTAKMESGLTILASIGSTAPFVGLLGTVWGIYHALVAIGMSGAGTLDKVAGPVGEALIMTALGLAVAIPAVLGYNFIVRANRLTLSRLDSFAHDLFTFLTTGAKIDGQIGSPNVAPLKRA